MAKARSKSVRFDDLPLFVASDHQLAEAIVGEDAEARQTWLAGIRELEAAGFPRRMPGYGRYRPAVKDFYDRLYHLHGQSPALPTSTPKDEGEWKTTRRRRPA